MASAVLPLEPDGVPDVVIPGRAELVTIVGASFAILPCEDLSTHQTSAQSRVPHLSCLCNHRSCHYALNSIHQHRSNQSRPSAHLWHLVPYFAASVTPIPSSLRNKNTAHRSPKSFPFPLRSVQQGSVITPRSHNNPLLRVPTIQHRYLPVLRAPLCCVAPAFWAGSPRPCPRRPTL